MNIEVSSINPDNFQSGNNENIIRKRLIRKFSKNIIYDKVYVFCDKASKYQKGSNTRERLTPAVEFRADERLRKLATQRCDSKILSITSRDIIAAEAHYHKTCYLNYTRERPSKSKTIDPHCNVVKSAYQQLYKFIREDLLVNPRVESQNFLLSKLISFMNESEVRASTRKNFQYNLEKEFGHLLRFVKIDGKIFIAPDNLTFDMLMAEYVRANAKFEDILNKDTNFVKPAAEQIRREIRSIDVNQVWTPSPPEMDVNSIKCTFIADSIPTICDWR